MKGLLLTTVITLVIGFSSAVPKCPPEEGALLKNPADCNTFYECVNGVPILMQCPPGLVWAEALKRCDFPEVAQCVETETQEPGTTLKPTSPRPSTARPTECPEIDDPEHDVLLPNPKDCGTFFKYLGGVPHLISCPSGQEWSIELNRCDYPEIANCKETTALKQIMLQSVLRMLSKKDDRCPAEDGPEDVLLPNPEDCTTFFKCNNGEAIIQECPAGLHWNDAGKYCDYPELAGCQKSKKVTKTQWPTKCPSKNEVYDFFMPNLEDCTTYYRCDNGVKHLMDCPVGTLWHAPMYRCDHANIAECATNE